MNGNRGAKGSIKDRLISMMYRMRYKKKELKEEEYRKSKKEQKVEYLNTLKRFEEKEDISVLEKKDIKTLDNINYDVQFKINKKGELETANVKEEIHTKKDEINTSKKIERNYSVTKKGINKEQEQGQVDLVLENIEYKTGELDEKVNVNTELKKTKNEITIIKEVNDFIEKSLENINEIQEELDAIRKESKEKNKDQTELEERYNKLKEKVQKLKKQYDSIKNKYDLSEFKIVESIKLIDSIDDYKSVARLNEMDMMLKVCKKEINRIDSITVVNEDTKSAGNSIEEMKTEQADVKIKFNCSKEKTESLKTTQNILEEELKRQKEIIDDMYEKASYFKKETHMEEYFVGRKNLLGSLFRMAGGLLTLPLTGRELFGVALGQTMINKGLKELNKPLEKRYREVTEYDYEDLSKKIMNVKDKLEYTNLIISDSLDEIEKLKNNFKNEYKDYDNILPEYEETLNKICKLENALKLEQEKISVMNKKLQKEDELNKEKMKKVR